MKAGFQRKDASGQKADTELHISNCNFSAMTGTQSYQHEI